MEGLVEGLVLFWFFNIFLHVDDLGFQFHLTFAKLASSPSWLPQK